MKDFSSCLVNFDNFRSQMTGKSYRLMTAVSCESQNIVYLVTCSKCKKQYVGKSSQMLRKRHYGHRREMELKSTPLGVHFAGDCGYQSWTMQVKTKNTKISYLNLSFKTFSSLKKYHINSILVRKFT